MKFVIGNPPPLNFKVFDDNGADVTQQFSKCRNIDIEIRAGELNVIKIEFTGEVEVEVASENVKAILKSLPVAENGLLETTAVGDEYRKHSKKDDPKETS